MHITPILLSAVALAALSTAAPHHHDPFLLATPVPSNDTLLSRGLDPRIRRVTYCEHAHKRGQCVTQALEGGACYGMARAFNDRMSSIYPIGRTVCFIYERGSCNGAGQMASVTDPGERDLKTIGMNDKVSSMRCQSY